MSAEASVLREFFGQYARARSTRDIDLIASQYADPFQFADPKGARVVAKAAVRVVFPKGLEHLKAQGHTSTRLTSFEETRLDEHYRLVRAQFVWSFERPPGRPAEVAVDTTFIVYASRGAFAIVFQQEREEFQEVLRSHGIVPPTF